MTDDYIVVASRVRLARNLEDYKFPHMQSKSKAEEVINLVFNACDSIGNFNNYKLKNLKDNVLQTYLIEHKISKDAIKNAERSGVSISSDNSVSIMINEEDMLREQCMLKGLSLKKAYDIINDIDNELSLTLPFAYDEKLGYLTACPTNVGTGIRASVMMFLPALTMTHNMEQVINTVSKMGISVRGTFGEGSSQKGYLFQISNQNSLGKTELEIIQNVESTVLKIIDLEKRARKQLLSLNDVELKNDILRAYGILANSYKISETESIELLSKVKLGLSLGIINLQSKDIIDDLLDSVNDVKINTMSAKVLNDKERDVFRANYLNRILKNERI